MRIKFLSTVLLTLLFHLTAIAQSEFLEPLDVFDIEYISDPQTSPDGEHF